MAVVGGRYQLERELGSGGTATVWLAHDVLLDRPAAVKVLHRVERGDSRRERLRTEARALAALNHACVVRVYDLGQHEGDDYIVMEYLERGSLADRLANEGPLPPAEAVDAVVQILGALGAAHSAGIVHRDVKPGNVLIRADGTAALCDFGIARTTLGGEGRTETGMALGSLGFMAPEQRIDARKAGPAADLYAAACTLFNLVTNDTPVDLYLAPDASPRWDDVPRVLRPALRRATRSEPSARFASAAEMAETLLSVRSALVGLQPARARRSPDGGTIGYVPTNAGTSASAHEPEPSTEAEHRVRALDADELGWAHRRRAPVGRTALWVGVSITAAATLVGLAAGPMGGRPPLEDLVASMPRVSRATRALDPEGTWRGSFGDNRAMLVLDGPPGQLDGELVLFLGSHELRSKVHGEVDANGTLVLTEGSPDAPRSTLVAHPNDSALILEGEMHRLDQPSLPFALVRID